MDFDKDMNRLSMLKVITVEQQKTSQPSCTEPRSIAEFLGRFSIGT